MLDRGILRLIAITDGLHGSVDNLIGRAGQAVEGGATCIQLRLKDVSPKELAAIARQMMQAVGVPLIINDRADVAMAVGAAGCHLGADDVPVSAIRGITPPDFVIGCSVGSENEIAGAEGADYAGIGPVFSTITKGDAGKAIGLDGFRKLASQLSIPVVGIGGISEENAKTVIEAGAAGVAVISSIFSARDVKIAATSIFRAIER